MSEHIGPRWIWEDQPLPLGRFTSNPNDPNAAWLPHLPSGTTGFAYFSEWSDKRYVELRHIEFPGLVFESLAALRDAFMARCPMAMTEEQARKLRKERMTP